MEQLPKCFIETLIGEVEQIDEGIEDRFVAFLRYELSENFLVDSGCAFDKFCDTLRVIWVFYNSLRGQERNTGFGLLVKLCCSTDGNLLL
jgi:hypothetical protein